jgi:hypothetical protein
VVSQYMEVANLVSQAVIEVAEKVEAPVSTES